MEFVRCLEDYCSNWKQVLVDLTWCWTSFVEKKKTRNEIRQMFGEQFISII